MSAAYLNAKKLKGAGKVLIAARHNLREIQDELGADGYIDAAKSRLNVVLAGPHDAVAVAALADDALPSKLRRDTVRAVELVISLPPVQSIDQSAFFNDSLTWIRAFFGVPVLSAVVHLDETEPHCHVLLLPVVDGRMVGSDLVGNRARLQLMQTDFHAAVSSRYGLTRPMAAKRTSKAIRDKVAGMVLDAILNAPECLARPNVRIALTDAIASSPDTLAAALGVSIPTGKARRERSFVEIMTAPAKPEPKAKPIGFYTPAKPIGFENNAIGKSKPYHCVGFDISPPQSDSTFTRESDHQDAALWDSELGEFRPVPQSANHTKTNLLNEG